MVVEPIEFVAVIVGSVVLSVIILAALWPWARDARRLAALAMGMTIGIIAWNVMLNLTGAVAMNVDSAYRVSAQDVGSGVFAFAVASLTLGLVADRDAKAVQVVGMAAIAGILTLLVDLFA
ncbi:MAG TPA: hypothetical protein VFZ25_14235 [Chloroflexota bacterium]|nr:hypothetical protein [Chloroflexota bacterium]